MKREGDREGQGEAGRGWDITFKISSTKISRHWISRSAMLCFGGMSRGRRAATDQDVVILPPGAVVSEALEELSALPSVRLRVRKVIRQGRHHSR
jgi:hypothetical protein